jgi:hypothetical protein
MNETHDSGVVSLKPSKKQLTEGSILGYPIGRDKKIVPPDEVQKLAALGCSNRDIANFFGIEESNVSRHFAAFITKGREEVKIALRRAMLDNACRNHNAAVQIFLAKNLLGMADIPVNTEDKKPLPWSDEE